MGNFALYSADGKKIKQNKKPTSLEDLKLCLKVRQGNGQVRTEAVQSQNQKQAKTISAVLDGKGCCEAKTLPPRASQARASVPSAGWLLRGADLEMVSGGKGIF